MIEEQVVDAVLEEIASIFNMKGPVRCRSLTLEEMVRCLRAVRHDCDKMFRLLFQLNEKLQWMQADYENFRRYQRLLKEAVEVARKKANANRDRESHDYFRGVLDEVSVGGLLQTDTMAVEVMGGWMLHQTGCKPPNCTCAAPYPMGDHTGPQRKVVSLPAQEGNAIE